MVDFEKIIVEKDNEEQFEEVRVSYDEGIENLLTCRDYDAICDLCNTISEYEDLFYSLDINEKLVFIMDDYSDTYVLE